MPLDPVALLSDPERLKALLASSGLDTSLAGTLSGLYSGEQAASDQLQKQLADRARAAQGTADTAQQTYQQAASEPAPGPSAEQGLTSLFGNLASAVSGQPRYAEQAQQRLAVERGQSAQRRMERLQALEQDYTRKAQMAAQLNNADLEFEFITKAQKVHQATEKISEFITSAAAKKEERAQDLKMKKMELGSKEREGAAERAKDIRVAEIMAGARGGAVREGFTAEGLMKKDYYNTNLIKLRYLAKNAKAPEDRENARTGLVELAANRLVDETSEAKMLERLIGMRDPADPSRYLLTGEPVYYTTIGAKLGLQRGMAGSTLKTNAVNYAKAKARAKELTQGQF